MFRSIILVLCCLAFSSLTLADDDEHEHHGHHHGHHYRGGDRDYYYERAPQYAAPSRSHQGLAGGVIGSVLGYEMGAGNPIFTGVGAAAGSYLGNGMAR
jgi:hypothetical protein